MKKLIPTIILSVIIAALIADNRIRAENARRQDAAQQTVAATDHLVKSSLANLLEATSRNPSAQATARALESEYATAQQTSAGIRAFNAALAKAKPQIMRPLVQPSRTRVAAYLFELTSHVNGHADSLNAKENTEKTAGGIFAKLRRDWGLADSQ